MGMTSDEDWHIFLLQKKALVITIPRFTWICTSSRSAPPPLVTQYPDCKRLKTETCLISLSQVPCSLMALHKWTATQAGWAGTSITLWCSRKIRARAVTVLWVLKCKGSIIMFSVCCTQRLVLCIYYFCCAGGCLIETIIMHISQTLRPTIEIKL